MQKIKENFRRINKKEAKASFYIVENLCYCYIKGVWGVAPNAGRQSIVSLRLCIDSHLYRCIVQRLCVAVVMHPCIMIVSD